MKYEIELLDGSQKKWTIQEYANLGSDSSCNIQIDLPGISARHTRF